MSYLFSILIPNLGYSHLLFECLDSAISQITKDLFDYEIIICDQSDADIYKQIKSEIEINYTANRIQLIHSEIKSLYLPRHTLMKYANGEYISFLDSDDIIDSDYLFELYKIIIENNHPDIIFTNFIKMSFDNKINTKINYLDTLNTNRILDYLRYGSCANPVCFKIF